jgi:YfiH family protein
MLMALPVPDPAFHWTAEAWGPALRCRALSAVAQHVFTSKQLALPSEDAWRAALASVDSAPDRLMRVKQVHGDTVRVLARGRVPGDAADQRPDGDAVISNVAGLALAVMVADCVPILVADARAGAAAAIHAGWRGTCARIAQAAIASMRREFGSRPEDLVAAIGPSAGPDDYEVGEPLVEAFRAAGHDQPQIDKWFIRTSRKPHLDLWSANRDQLVAAGLRADHIHLCRLSTVSHPDVFDSYRVAAERAGRMAGIITVPATATAGPPAP